MIAVSIQFARRLLIPCLILALTACSDDAPAPPVTVDGPRLVSLSPAITRILTDLELDDAIVGRTRFCRGLPADVPVVGDLFDVDLERLHELRPTHILVQAPASGVDPGLLANLPDGALLASWASVNTIADVRELVLEIAEWLAPTATDDSLRARGSALVTAMDAALVPTATTGWRGRTLLVYGTDPVSIFGRETYLDDLLASLGAENASEASDWTQLTLEDVVRLDPAAIILIGGPDDADPALALGPLAALDVDAVRTGRLGIVRHPDALIPSSSVIEVAEEMRQVLDAMPGEEESG